MIDVNKDVSNLSSVSVTTLKNLSRLQEKLICHYVLESEKNDEQCTVVDVGIGELHIKHVNGEILYKFIPSNYLDEQVEKTIVKGTSPVILDTTETLINRITSTYKDLF